jgi:hypothetical protein
VAIKAAVGCSSTAPRELSENDTEMAEACVLSDRQSANHPFVNGVGYSDASITALVQFLWMGEDNHAAFVFVTVCLEKPVSSATSRTVYAGFKGMREIVLA